MPTVTVRLPTEALLDLPPAFLATLVNPRRLRALLNDMSDEEIAHLFGEDLEEVPVVEPAPLVPPALQKRRGRPPKQHGAEMEGTSGTIVQNMPRPRKPRGGPVAVTVAELEAVHAALTDEASTGEELAAIGHGIGFPVVKRALEILAANGQALLGEDGYRRVPGQASSAA